MTEVLAVDINVILGVALGYLIATFVRYLQRSRFWRGVRRGAGDTLQDPASPVVDPREAAERALVEAMRPKVDEVARSITIPPPFGNGDAPK